MLKGHLVRSIHSNIIYKIIDANYNAQGYNVEDVNTGFICFLYAANLIKVDQIIVEGLLYSLIEVNKQEDEELEMCKCYIHDMRYIK